MVGGELAPELGVVLAVQHRGDAATDGSVSVSSGDLDVAAARVGRLPGHDGGLCQGAGPGEQLGGIGDDRGDVADDVDLLG